jgi:hypothetical protein
VFFYSLDPVFFHEDLKGAGKLFFVVVNGRRIVVRAIKNPAALSDAKSRKAELRSDVPSYELI